MPSGNLGRMSPTYVLVLAIDRPTVSAVLGQVAQFAHDAGVAGRVELQVGPRFV